MTTECLSFVEIGVLNNGSIKTRRYSQSERETYIEEWRRSKLSMNAYCRQNALALSSFSQWVKKLKVTTTHCESKNDDEKSIPKINHTGIMELTLTNGIRLRFTDTSNLSEVVRLVKALKSCS